MADAIFKSVALSLILSIGNSMPAQQTRPAMTAGYHILIYQSVYQLENSAGMELSLGLTTARSLFGQFGARVSTNGFHPEVFVRGGILQTYGKWMPSAGLEAGWTDRARFGPGDQLLRETREAIGGDIGKLYMAIHISPLAFSFGRNWRLSILDMQIGTHLQNPGRTLRVQGGIVTVRRSFSELHRR